MKIGQGVPPEPKRKARFFRIFVLFGRLSKKKSFIGSLAAFFILAMISALILAIRWDHEVRDAFAAGLWQIPSTVYARSLEIYPGAQIDRPQLVDEFQRIGYQANCPASSPGQFCETAQNVEVWTREFRHWEGIEGSAKVTVRHQDQVIDEIISDKGESIDILRIEPPVIGHIYPSRKELRQLVALKEVPTVLAQTLVAVEDREFYHHLGIDPKGIVRAMWHNLRAGRIVQGGSTLTQQLVKNLFLTSEQSLVRKFREAIMALLIEWHYSKEQILEAYLNEVFLGQSRAGAIHGFGLASLYYFGIEIGKLELHQMATLIALVNGPSHYDPLRHPDRALARRNLVLKIMDENQIANSSDIAQAIKSPLVVRQEKKKGSRFHPAFLDLVQQQLNNDYSQQDLQSTGLKIFSTLDPRIQDNAEISLRNFLKPHKEIEGAVVATAPQTGEVLAMVGGKNPEYAGFNRAILAKRPIGSLIKPFITLTALESGLTLAKNLRDEPIEILLPNKTKWAPKNYDGVSHGQVPLLRALAKSYNQAFVQLGLELGTVRVAKTLSNILDQEIPKDNPSLLLGAIDLTPLEVTKAYQTLASGGFSLRPKAVLAVIDGHGEPLKRFEQEMQEVVEPKQVHLAQFAMTAVMHMGTGASAYQQIPSHIELAGKTGTTNDSRDSWFAGFSQDILAVVWIGRDDNAKTPFTGATGALRVWSSFMHASKPQPLQLDSFLESPMKPVSMTTGALTSASCEDAIMIPLPENADIGENLVCPNADLDPLIKSFHNYQLPIQAGEK